MVTRLALLIFGSITVVSCAQRGGALPQSPVSEHGALLPETSGYRVVYSFGVPPAGNAPTALTAVAGTLFGTTASGGTKGFGTVFVRDPSGKVRYLHSFGAGADGAQPEGTLVAAGGSLYGTTQYGGKSGNGTVFAVTRAGKERVLYSFKGGNDGATPVLVGLVLINGVLYGTTSAGGETSCHLQGVVGCGTVFAVTTAGKERVLYRFKGKADAASPSGRLRYVNNALYGTSALGGINNNGTVFTITTAGAERVVYAFKGYPDGALPYTGITAVGTTLYGATTAGGARDNSGTIFTIDASGAERILYSFKGYPDGAVPFSNLLFVHGLLYGTTRLGGNAARGCQGGPYGGCGTVFSVDTSGNERVVRRFRGAPDGADPWSGLVLDASTLYGTTFTGGASNHGTIYQLTGATQ